MIKDCRPNQQVGSGQLDYLKEEQPLTHCVGCHKPLPMFRDPKQVLCGDMCVIQSPQIPRKHTSRDKEGKDFLALVESLQRE